MTIGIDDLVDPRHRPGAAAHRVRRPRSPPPAPAGWPATATSPGIVIGPEGQPLDLGRSQAASFPPHLRRAVDVRDRAACSPAATPPRHWCDAHHVLRMVLDDGPTSVDNGALLCERHHTKVHHGFRIERQPDGRWRTYRPDGTEILARHPAPGLRDHGRAAPSQGRTVSSGQCSIHRSALLS